MLIAIDNGISGAACCFKRNRLADYITMPTQMRLGKNEVDLLALQKWIKQQGRNPVVVAEEPLRFAATLQSMRSMMLCYGSIKGMCLGNGWEFHDIQVNDWQRAMLGKFGRGQSKKVALRKAKALLPKEKWLDPSSPRSRTPHDGIVDAYLIGKYFLKTKK